MSELRFQLAQRRDGRYEVARIDNAFGQVSLENERAKESFMSCLIAMFGMWKLTLDHPEQRPPQIDRSEQRKRQIYDEAKSLLDNRNRGWRKKAFQPSPQFLKREETISFLGNSTRAGDSGLHAFFVIEKGEPAYNPAVTSRDLGFFLKEADGSDKELKGAELFKIVKQQFDDSPSPVREQLSYRVTLHKNRPRLVEDQPPLAADEWASTINIFADPDAYHRYWFYRADLQFQRRLDGDVASVIVGMEVLKNVRKSLREAVFYRECFHLPEKQDWDEFTGTLAEIKSTPTVGERHRLLLRGFDFQMTVNEEPATVAAVEQHLESYRLTLALPESAAKSSDPCRFHMRTIGLIPKSRPVFPFYVGESTLGVELKVDCDGVGIDEIACLPFFRTDDAIQPEQVIEGQHLVLRHEGLCAPGLGCVVLFYGSALNGAAETSSFR